MTSERGRLVEEMLQAFYSDQYGMGEFTDMERALTVAEAAFERRERHEPIGCPTPGACSCLRNEAAIRKDERKIWADYFDRVKPVTCKPDGPYDRGFRRACQYLAITIRARDGE